MANISGYIDYAASVKAPSKTDDELYTLLGTNSKGSVVNISKITNVTVNASTGALNANLSGNVDSATQVLVTSNSNNATHYLNFVDVNNASSNKSIHTDGNLTCNPSTNTITATTFNGNATTSTTATNIAGGGGGSIPYQSAVDTTALLANGTVGQVLTSSGTTLAPAWSSTFSGTATAATKVTVTDTNSATVYYPVFVSSAGAGRDLGVDIATGPFSYVPSTSTLTVSSGSIVTPNINNGSNTLIIGNIAGGNMEIASASASTGTMGFCTSNGSTQVVQICNGNPFGGTLNICSRALSGTLNIASGSGETGAKTGPINIAAGDNTGTLTIGNNGRVANINGSTIGIGNLDAFTGSVNIGNGSGSSTVNIGLNYAKTGGSINIGTQNGNQAGAGGAGSGNYATAGNSILLNARYNTVAAYSNEFYSAAYQTILGPTNNTGIVRINQKVSDAIYVTTCLGYQVTATSNTVSNYTNNVFSPSLNAFPTAATNNYVNVASISIPANTFAIITATLTYTNRADGISISRYAGLISTTQANNTGTTGNTEAAVGLSMYSEPNPDNGNVLQVIHNLCGVYANATGSSVLLYANVMWNQAWTTIGTNSPLIAASIQYTKIG